MRSLDIKLFRDLWGLKGQAVAISAVLAAGIATYVLSASTLDSLTRTQARLYADYRFPDLFGALKRAPRSVVARIEAIPGIQTVEVRVAAPANLELEGFAQPISGQMISLPKGPAVLNRLHIKAGRLPEEDREREVVVSDGFALAHKIKPGTVIRATINGRRRSFDIVGVASTPEFIYQLAPGSIVPDFRTYAILWMNPGPLEAAYDMTGAFNQVAAKLAHGTRVEDAAADLDHVLRPYGGLGAHGRKDQISHRYLSEEFKQLANMATMFPAIFLSVAAFLLSVVMTRLMATQRGQIAVLKSFGYTSVAIAVHYLELALVIVSIGMAMGVAGGAWLGRGLANLYMEVYRFPYLEFAIRPGVIAISAGVSLACALAGALFTVVNASRESPAVAMQPQAPSSFRPSLIERAGLGGRLSQPTRIIFRNIERRPVKSILSVAGVGFSTAILVLGNFWGDAADYMVFAQLRRAQLDDLTVTFVAPVARSALHSLKSIPGVTHAEATRTVASRLRFEHRTYRTAIQGVEPDGSLRRLLDRDLRPVMLPPNGVLLTDFLAKILGVRTGDLLTVELLEGNRAVRQVPVAGVVSEYIGVAAYMQRESLNRFLREGDIATGALLAAEMSQSPLIYARLKESPAVAGTVARMQALASFYETLAKQMLTFAFFNTLLASTIAIGVVYNTARITLSERSRELASLRVLGYTRGEVSYILLGELAVLVFTAVPVGLMMGYLLAALMAETANTELFRIPVVIEPSSYAFSALVVTVATVVSALLVRRRVDRLDLVEVLKAKE
jgi:putative ABC transport system permease protein